MTVEMEPRTRPAVSYGVFGTLGLVVPAVVWLAADTQVVSSTATAVGAILVLALVGVASAWRTRRRIPRGAGGVPGPVSGVQSVANGVVLLLLGAAVSGGLCLAMDSWTGAGLLAVLACSALGRAAMLAAAERRGGVVLGEGDEDHDPYVALRR